MLSFDDLHLRPLAQRWRQQLYPLPVVGAIIRREDSYLLIRRHSEPYQGLWALVGGKWDFGEELATAVIREVKEESGLDAQFVALRAVLSERFINEGEAAHFVIFLCELTAEHGTATEQNEGAVAWFSRAEIDALHAQNTIVPSDYAMLAAFADSTQTAPIVEVDMLNTKNGTEMRRFAQMDK